MDNAGKLATQDEEKQDKNTTRYVLDTTKSKQTQITKLIHQPSYKQPHVSFSLVCLMIPLFISVVCLPSLIPHDRTMSMYSYFMFLRFHLIYSTKLISFSERAFSLCWQYFYFYKGWL